MFVSCGQGVARFYKAKKRHVITTQTEHKCVLDSCRVLEAEGFAVTYLPVKANGLVDLEVETDRQTDRQTDRHTHTPLLLNPDGLVDLEVHTHCYTPLC